MAHIYIFEARYLHGNRRHEYGGHEWEGYTHYLGKSAVLPRATFTERKWEGADWGDWANLIQIAPELFQHQSP